MSFLNQSSLFYNGNDLYQSNKRENSNIGVLEFEDIFEDLDIQHLKKTHKKFEKNNSMHVSHHRTPEDDKSSQGYREKARTDTIQNQSSFNTIGENCASSNNFKQMNSFYSKAKNLNKSPPQKEEAILNNFKRKNSEFNKNQHLMMKNMKQTNPPFFENDVPKAENIISPIKNPSEIYSQRNSNDESQNIVNIIKHLSMADYPQNFQKSNKINENQAANNIISLEDFQKVYNFHKRINHTFLQFIDNSSPNDIIQLPHTRISLSCFKITKPLTIQGSVHTILEITEGPITIDLSNFNANETPKVVFSECNISFDIGKAKFSTSKIPPLLFFF